jgi:HK97 family phage prohead protease
MPASVRDSRRERVSPLTDYVYRDAVHTGDGSHILEGIAAVTGEETTLYRGKGWEWREVIEPGAFDAVLASSPLVHLNIGHDMGSAVASTRAPGPIGRLELSVTPEGLRAFAKLDPVDADVARMHAKMTRGVMDQMSFAFRIGDMETRTRVVDGVEIETDHIRSVSDLYDVCVCAQGAYPQTTVEMRERITAREDRDASVSGPVAGSAGDASSGSGGSTVSPQGVPVPSPLAELRLKALRQRAANTKTRSYL